MATQALSRSEFAGFDWPRIGALSGTITVHLVALMLLLMPLAPQLFDRHIEPDPPINVQIIVPEPSQPLPIVPPTPTPPVHREHTPPSPHPITTVQPIPSSVIENTDAPEPALLEPASSDVDANSASDVPPSTLSYAGTTRVDYPNESKRHHEHGIVMLRVLVGEDGTPQRVEIEKSSGYVRLDRAARESVMQWHFNPGTREGKPHAAWGLVPIAFRLEEI